MAVVTVKSGPITNRDALPKVTNNASVSGGNLKAFAGVAAVGNGDSTGSTYIMGSVPSNARIQAVLLYCTAITSGAANIGIYRTTADGGAAVSASLFASAASIASALAAGSEVTHQSGTFPVANIEQPLWQALGLSADPCLMYDIVITLSAGTTAAGTVALKVAYAS